MACPFFDPESPISWVAWPNPPRMPLGDPYHGGCTVTPCPSGPPAETEVRERCNTGYARGLCSRFPVGDIPDAVRFGLVSMSDELATIRYVLERNHLPFADGVLKLTVTPESGAAVSLLERQARAYLGSYLRRNEMRRDDQPRQI